MTFDGRLGRSDSEIRCKPYSRYWAFCFRICRKESCVLAWINIMENTKRIKGIRIHIIGVFLRLAGVHVVTFVFFHRIAEIATSSNLVVCVQNLKLRQIPKVFQSFHSYDIFCRMKVASFEMSSSIAGLVVLFAFLTFRASIKRSSQIQSLRVRLYASPYGFTRAGLLSLLVLATVTMLGFDARQTIALSLHSIRMGARGRHPAHLYLFRSAEDACECSVGSRGVASIGAGISVLA
jgi:hypothetical protein